MEYKSQLSEKIVQELKEGNHFTHFIAKDDTKALTQDILVGLCNKSQQISIVDNVLCYTTEGNDIIKMPDFELGVDSCSDWLSNYLVSPTFDVFQDGNLRKAAEAEAAYICLNIRVILSDKNFKQEFAAVVDNYDYENLKANSETHGKNFRTLLEEWQSINSFAINVIISAARMKISTKKQDTEKFLRDGLSEGELTGLKDLEANIKMITEKYSGFNGPLRQENIKRLKKKEILSILDDQYGEISKILESSNYGTLYKIMKLSTEYISPTVKKEMEYKVKEKVDSYFSESYESKFEEKESFRKKLYNRVIRLQRTSVRKTEILKYIEDKAGYSLPSKA